MTILGKRSIHDLLECNGCTDCSCDNYQPCLCNGINGYDGS